MYSQDGAREPDAKNSKVPVQTAKPVEAGGVPVNGPFALQRTIGNAAVVQLLRASGRLQDQDQDRHRHGDGCGHEQAGQAGQAPVQRSAVHGVLRGAGRPLDRAVRTDMEARLGADFSDVRIHNDAAAKASAAEIGARAYTSGSHVVIGDGGADKHTLAHELTHVIQQRQGPVAGTDNGSGLSVSDPSDRFEREAEANATAVMRGPAAIQRLAEGAEGTETGPASGARSEVSGQAVQRTKKGEKSKGEKSKEPGASLQGEHIFNAFHDVAARAATSLRSRLDARQNLLRQSAPDMSREDRASVRDFKALHTAAIAALNALDAAVGPAATGRDNRDFRAAMVGATKSSDGDQNSIEYGAFSQRIDRAIQRCGSSLWANTDPLGDFSLGMITDQVARQNKRGEFSEPRARQFDAWYTQTATAMTDLFAALVAAGDAVHAVLLYTNAVVGVNSADDPIPVDYTAYEEDDNAGEGPSGT
ncbi:eCIS core domain-containing protein [Streptomyces sp. NPDC055107]